MGPAILLGIFAVGIGLGIPVAFCMGIAAAAFFYEGFPLLITFQRIISSISIFSLLAIPFFTFAGEIMLHGGIAVRLVRFASTLVCSVRGGLASVNIFSSMLFGGVSGSAVADISALGSLLTPVMTQKGYRGDYAVNVTVTSSIAGIVIPPSHNMIIFAVAAGGGISISKLFLAGVVPGVLMCVLLAVAAYILAIKHKYPAGAFPGFKVVGVSAAAALPGMVTAVIIVGGVLSGVFTVTESGAFGAIYALSMTTFVYRSLSWKDFITAVTNSVRTTAMVMILIGCAGSFAYLLALYRVPGLLNGLLVSVSDNPLVILFMLNVILLLLGMIMDMAALILICTPIFLPIAREIGMDPVQFGIMLLMNLGLGLCTPPVGACLFVGCAVGKIPMEQALRSIWPFYLAMFVALMLVTYIPAISLTLPALFGSGSPCLAVAQHAQISEEIYEYPDSVRGRPVRLPDRQYHQPVYSAVQAGLPVIVHSGCRPPEPEAAADGWPGVHAALHSGARRPQHNGGVQGSGASAETCGRDRSVRACSGHELPARHQRRLGWRHSGQAPGSSGVSGSGHRWRSPRFGNHRRYGNAGVLRAPIRPDQPDPAPGD